MFGCIQIKVIKLRSDCSFFGVLLMIIRQSISMVLLLLALIVIILIGFVYYKTFRKELDKASKEIYELKKQNEVLQVRLKTEKELLSHVNYYNIKHEYVVGSVIYAGMIEAQKLLAQKGHKVYVHHNEPEGIIEAFDK